ncbi:ankyrin repeat-containing domain protein [Roridomyces roridus]|uniref:Ankyrin repeat-containing domain protein n=1 Tax=Roridomyces roridus TaxID=1738132 RepID=A0AAD7BDW7_9AGAR|nr:ankyrin repeat-containing domain protein [Roridomyces roridus]
MEAADHIDLIGRLKLDVETYARLLEESFNFVSDYDYLGGTTRATARQQLKAGFKDLQRKLDSFGARFRNNRLVDLAIHQNTIEDTLDRVHDMAVEKKLEEWLQSPLDMRHKQHETQKLRHAGTGRWFLEGERFLEWQDNAGSFWIQGASGTGKSVLSSSIIQKLLNDRELFADLGKPFGLGFFYFDFKCKDESAVEAALRRIVLQLSAQAPRPFRLLDKCYCVSRGQVLPTREDLQRMLTDLFKEIGRVYIVVDALDECPDAELAQLLSFISLLREWKDTPLHLVFTSQPRSIFTESFMDVPSVLLDPDAIQADIKLFITSELRENRQLKIWARRTDDIVERVLVMSNGMFRLAACLLLELSRCKRQTELDKTLANLPNDLFGIYDRFVETVRQEDLVYVTGIFRWLIYSAQSLDLAEIGDALAFDFSDPTCYIYDPNLRDDNVQAIPEWVEGLTTVRQHDGRRIISLAHASVQDYLFSGRFTEKFGFDLAQGPSHDFISHSCLRYLLHFSDHPLDEATLPNHPMAQYMARRWCHHLVRSNTQTVSFDHAIQLLQDDSNQYAALNDLRRYQNTHSRRGSRFSTWKPARVQNFHPGMFRWVPPLIVCAEDGYIEGVRWLLNLGADVNFQDAGGSALHASSIRNRPDIVSLLLDSGIDVNVKDKKGRTALEIACAENNTTIVRLLLGHGADTNSNGAFLGTALQTAAWVGNEELVKLLLERGANINARGEYFGSALQAAASRGNTDIARVLLEHGADCNRLGGHYGSALAAASMNGHTDPIRLLLEHGANVNINQNATVPFWGSFMQADELRMHNEAERLLLANGTDVRARIPFHGSALEAAATAGRAELVRFLLQAGAEANRVEGVHESALCIAASQGDLQTVEILLDHASAKGQMEGMQAACSSGRTDIVKFLLASGARVPEDILEIAARHGRVEVVEILLESLNVDTRTDSALCAAIKSGHIDFIRLLLEHGGAIPREEHLMAELLDAACANGQEEIVRLLLDNGADVNGNSSDSRTPLQAAACKGKIDIVGLLLQRGADVNVTTAFTFPTALQAASFLAGNTEVIRLLIENGADVNAQTGEHGTALHEAVWSGARGANSAVVDLLLASGADPNIQTQRHGAPLAPACRNGDIRCVQLLLAHGANINAQGGQYNNALTAACQSKTNTVEMVRLLLEHGADPTLGNPMNQLSFRHEEIVRLLLEHGAADTMNRRYGSALQEASRFGDVDLVCSLLARSSDVNEEGGKHGTALRAASKFGHIKVVRLLLRHGADVNAQGGVEGSALYDADDSGHTEIVRLLVKAGAAFESQRLSESCWRLGHLAARSQNRDVGLSPVP